MSTEKNTKKEELQDSSEELLKSSDQRDLIKEIEEKIRKAKEKKKQREAEQEAAMDPQKEAKRKKIQFGLWLAGALVITAMVLTDVIYTWYSEGQFSFPLSLLMIAGVWIIGVSFIRFHLPNWVSIILMVIMPATGFFLMECMTHDAWTMDASVIVINLLVFYFFFLLFFFATGSSVWGIAIASGFFAAVGLANYIVLDCRNVPILPWDFASLKTALSVSDNYKVKLTVRVGLLTIGFIAWMMVASHSALKLKKIPVRIIGTVVSVILILTMNTLTHQTSFEEKFMHANYLFTTKASYRDNGFFITFMQYLKYMKISKPSGYDVKKLDEQLYKAAQKYDAEHGDHKVLSDEQKPNVIVIMDEAFSDLAVLGKLEVNKDYMPFLRELAKSDRCISGWMDMSVCGGNTASSEFELLTNNSMYFLPNGSVAYQQYISSEIPSLAQVLNGQGYQSTAIHPYNASGWDRDEVYAYMGFEKFYSLKDFHSPKKLRKYVSDQAGFDKIVEIYEKNSKATGKPQFIFEVTMQNHGGYSEIFDNCPIEVEALNVKWKAMNNYLTLVSHTDQAMENLIGYFEKTDDPTMIVMFGDHQPNDYSIMKLWSHYGEDQSALTTEQLMERYVVPFYIWTNYDTGNSTDNYDFISPNYLSTIFLDHAGLELSDYQKYLFELKEELPVICQNCYRDADGKFYANGESSEYDDKLKEYRSLQYNFLFDDQKGNEAHYSTQP